MIILWEPSRGKNRLVICLAFDKWSFGRSRRGEEPRSLLVRKRGRKWKVSEVKPHATAVVWDLEDGAAPRPCHVSVRWRNADTLSQKESNICDLALDLPAFTLRRRGWTLLPLRSNHLVKCRKCGVGADQLHSGYSCRILCIVVRILCLLFSALQNPGERY